MMYEATVNLNAFYLRKSKPCLI